MTRTEVKVAGLVASIVTAKDLDTWLVGYLAYSAEHVTPLTHAETSELYRRLALESIPADEDI